MHLSHGPAHSVPKHYVPNQIDRAAPFSPEDIIEDLDYYIPVGTVTANLRIKPDGVLVTWPVRHEWEEANLAFRCVRLAHPAELGVEDILRAFTTDRSIRLFGRRHPQDDQKGTFRVYVLPEDVGRQFRDPRANNRQRCLMHLMPLLDTSLESWEGDQKTIEVVQEQKQEQHHDDSLFYIFNTLPSPPPYPADVSCPFAKAAMTSLLDVQPMPRLKTSLYSYQKRSAAEMVRRETEPLLRLDPRLEIMEGPTGRGFYYDRHSGLLLRDKREYEEARGGILAETMGLGKTLICLATILATKGHWPRIPPQYSTDLHPIRPKVGSLVQMAAAAINRQQLPWRPYFQDLSDAGEHYGPCVAALEENIGSYVIPAPITRGRKKDAASKGQRIYLCSATLVIVPENLFLQWKSEIALHLKEGALKVLSMQSLKSKMPSRAALLSYDIVLMTKKRFEQEFVNTRLGGTPDTPLKELHFLRVIADEGHAFASSGETVKVVRGFQSLHVERRWIISGTPTAGLLGVEVDLATNETSQEQFTDSTTSKQSALAARQKISSSVQERRDLEHLGKMVTNFLRLKPWANSWNDDRAAWRTYVLPSYDGVRKPRSLRNILESLVVRHQIEAVEMDVQLPPLYNRVVYLQPSWHDKLSINLFVLSLTVNAVTSERVDEDYMFHPRNKKQLEQLIKNLRQSGFYWTSFSSEDIGKTLEVSSGYLEKPVDPRQPNTEDRILLIQAMDAGRLALESHSWKAFTELNELGIYVEDFPDDACSAWSLVPRGIEDPLLAGATQLTEAQKYVDSRLYFRSPATGLDVFGTTTKEKLRQSAGSKAPEELKLTEKHTKSKATTVPKPRQKRSAQDKQAVGKTDPSRPTTALKSAMKASKSDTVEPLSSDSPLAKAKISGTASAKLSYLLDRVVFLQREEKILIFYEGDQIAYYIAQAFDLVNIEYRIYTGTLSATQRNDYIDTFNMHDSCRVLLMNMRLAAHGLHMAKASRVFFVNPVWQPNVEAQAIKRAHRIGQTRPVYVETLVLKDTLEDQMLQRRKQMTTEEHQTAQKSMLDDPIMRELIQMARPIPFAHDEKLEVKKQMAPLETPQRLFGRVHEETTAQKDPDTGLSWSGETNTSNTGQQSRKRKAVEFDPAKIESPSSRRKLNESVCAKESKNMNISSAKADRANMDTISKEQTTHHMVDEQHALLETSSGRRVAFADDEMVDLQQQDATQNSAADRGD